MHRLFPAGIETLASAIVLIPVLFYLNKRLFPDGKRTVLCGGFGLYLAAVYALAGLPTILYIRFEPNFNFEPFAYMFSDLDATVLNVLLFIPLGLALPMLWKSFSQWWKTVLFGFLASAFIETMQMFTFRATDVNDLMTNTLGTVLGFCLAKLLLRLFPELPSEQERELTAIFLLTLGIRFFIQPFVSGFLWNILL